MFSRIEECNAGEHDNATDYSGEGRYLAIERPSDQRGEEGGEKHKIGYIAGPGSDFERLPPEHIGYNCGEDGGAEDEENMKRLGVCHLGDELRQPSELEEGTRDDRIGGELNGGVSLSLIHISPKRVRVP